MKPQKESHTTPAVHNCTPQTFKPCERAFFAPRRCKHSAKPYGFNANSREYETQPPGCSIKPRGYNSKPRKWKAKPYGNAINPHGWKAKPRRFELNPYSLTTKTDGIDSLIIHNTII